MVRWARIRQICNIKPENVATVSSKELLEKLEDLDFILREGFAGMDVRNPLAVQTKPHMIKRLLECRGQVGPYDMEEIDRE